ncbi:PstS family phosphate ABC transporter substrate-binding protein [Candidatus Poribacteria bacterium]|nr:PstS family phosphate ABC transporter substrate-binding protein [Candidatus Poribacteria bacterium]
MFRLLRKIGILTLAVGLFLASVTLFAAERTLIKIDGSSTVYPITEVVAEEFQKSNPNVKVTVGISGTGGGFKKFGRGETDISDASRPIKPSEVELCKQNGVEYIELPVAFDGLAIMVNPKNMWVDHLTVAELKKLWEPEAQGKITHWNQIRPEWPKEKIALVGAGVDSGTYDYFTEAIVGKEGASRGDFVASEDDNVLVQAIANNRFAIGFFGLAYYEENKELLKLVPIDDEKKENGDGPIFPTLETVKNGTYQPLSRPIFIYVSQKAAQRPEIEKFIAFYLKHAKTLVQEVSYIPLPDEVYQLVLGRFQKRVTGSVFGGKGSTTGVSIDEILRREMK